MAAGGLLQFEYLCLTHSQLGLWLFWVCAFWRVPFSAWFIQGTQEDKHRAKRSDLCVRVYPAFSWELEISSGPCCLLTGLWNDQLRRGGLRV